MRKVRITRRARKDLRNVIAKVFSKFGEGPARESRDFLFEAIRGIGEDPSRDGVKQVPVSGSPMFAYHLRHSRERVRLTGKPQHILVFEVTEEELQIVRVLHESMDPERLLQ